MTGTVDAQTRGRMTACRGWTTARVGTRATFQVGFPFQSRFFTKSTRGIRLVRNGDLKRSEDAIFYDGPYDQRYLVEDGDILIGMDGDFLPCRWSGGRALLNQRVGRLLGGSSASPEYLYYALREPLQQIELMTSATTVKHLSHSDVERIELEFPNQPEQEAIAEVLSDADDLIASLERLVGKKRDIKQGAMQLLLTGRRRLPGFNGEWSAAKMATLGQTYGGLTGKTKADFGTGPSQYVPFMDVMSQTVIDCVELPTVLVRPGESQNQIEPGDLLFNGSSETPDELAFCAAVRSVPRPTYLNSFCFGFRLNSAERANPLFIAYMFRSNVGRHLIRALAQGATRYNLSKAQFRELEVPLPEPDEQRAITNVLSDMDAEILALEARLAKARDIKQGMMQELLTGRTRLPVSSIADDGSPNNRDAGCEPERESREAAV